MAPNFEDDPPREDGVRIGKLVLIYSPLQLLQPGGEPVVLRQQSLSVLKYLALSKNRPVSKDDLLNNVWKDKCVTEASVYQCIKEIRHVLNDNDRKILKTISKIGYQLNAKLDVTDKISASEAVRDIRDHGRLAIPPADSFRQEIRYTSSADGTSIAYALSGRGSPIVRAPTWMSHLDLDWIYEPIGPLVRTLSYRMCAVRFDARGAGLSDRKSPGHIEQWVEDLNAVITASGLKKPAVLGSSGSSMPAIRFATQFPERLSCLILLGGACRGGLHRGVSRETIEAFSHLIRQGWGQKNQAFIQLMTSSLFPGATQSEMKDFNELQKRSGDADTAAQWLLNMADTNVQGDLARISVPTLILHSKNDHRIPRSEAMLMANRIPNSELHFFESENHVPIAREPAFDVVMESIFEFVERHAILS